MVKPKRHLYLEDSNGNGILAEMIHGQAFIEGEIYRLNIPEMRLKGKYKCVGYQISDRHFQAYLDSSILRDWFIKSQSYV